VFRRHNQIALTLLILCDLAVVLGSWNLAYWLRFHAINFPPAQILRLTPHSLEPAVAAGLPASVAEALLARTKRAYTSAYELSGDVTDVLRRQGAQQFAGAVLAQAIGDASLPPYAGYARVTPVLLLLTALVFYAHGVYRARRLRSLAAELRGVLGGAAIVLLVTFAVSFFYRQGEYSRVHMLYFAALVVGLLAVERTAFRAAVRALRRRGYLMRRLLLVGDSELAAEFYARLRAGHDLGVDLIGLVTPGPATETPALQALPRLGALADLEGILGQYQVDHVVSALTLRQAAHSEVLGGILDEHTVDHRIVPDLGRAIRLRIEAETFDGLPLVVVSQGPLEGWNQVFKRVFDLAGSLVALLVFSPFFAAIPPLIKLTSPGPVIYAQERMGWNGKRFAIYKFRSMPVDAEQRSGPVWATESDRRPTRLGAFLRRSNLDEIPQLWNVFRGDMSLVGPRPERPVFIEQFKKQIPGYMLRHKIKAGITGWAQVNGWRGDTSLEKRIECDLFYISNWSIAFDFRILLLTAFRGFFHRNAY
jgi:exopolysaccharide biosynthesis polyprenyl glycosylphosphotransferase